MIDGVFAVGEDGQVHFAEAAALTPEDLAAVQQQVRARVLRWSACCAGASLLRVSSSHLRSFVNASSVIALAAPALG